MALTGVDTLRARAEEIARRVPTAKVVDTNAAAGGGSLPGRELPSIGVAVEVADVDRALAELRAAHVIGRARAGDLVCDLRAVEPADDGRLADVLAALRPG
jgi:L-seryl-tRNA(Ser) seleniumtransferase